MGPAYPAPAASATHCLTGFACTRNALQVAKLIQLKELPSVAAIRQVLLDQEVDLVLARRRSELLREVLVAFEREIELERS